LGIDLPEQAVLDVSQLAVGFVEPVDEAVEDFVGSARFQPLPQGVEGLSPLLAQAIPVSERLPNRRQHPHELIVVQVEFFLQPADVQAFDDLLERRTLLPNGRTFTDWRGTSGTGTPPATTQIPRATLGFQVQNSSRSLPPPQHLQSPARWSELRLLCGSLC
jgi:hypothetical protein